MLRNFYYSVLLILFSGAAFGQSSSIQGVVTDAGNGQPLAFVNVALYRDGSVVTGTTTDFDGKYVIKPLEAGVYDVSFTYIGYTNKRVNGVTVNTGKIRFLDQTMSSGVQLETAEVIVYKEPLINKDGGASGGTVSRENLAKMPGRDAAAFATTVGGVGTAGTNGISIRGARSNSTWIYIDGIKVRGSSSLPKSAIEEVAVLTGGIPANIGDATGGVINITLRGASRKFAGGFELITSGFKSGETAYGLDRYGYNLIEGSLTGPLAFKKDAEGNKTDPLLGFFFSGNYTSSVDPRPTFGGVYRMKEDVRQEIFDNPLIRNEGTSGGALYATSFLGPDAFERVPTRLNSGSKNATAVMKVDVSTNETTNLTFGATGSVQTGNAFNRGNSLMNWENNTQFLNYDWRVYGKFSQRFVDDAEESEASNLKNVFYTIMVDYSKSYGKTQDEDHKDDYFKYGHVGNFDVLSRKSYTFDFEQQALIQDGYEDTLVTFTPSDYNPILSSINNQYFSLFENQAYNSFDPGPYASLLEVQNGNGLLNGEVPSSIYGLWTYAGVNGAGFSYGINDNSQFRVTANGSADIGDHAVQLGFEYEQRRDAGFFLNPTALWNTARLLTNSHIEAIDEDNFWLTYEQGTVPFINYGRLVGDNQFKFDYRLRQALGLDPRGDDLLNVDGLNPEFLSLDFFGADELLNQNLAVYYGYDAFGNKDNNQYSLNDFFTEEDELGYRTRPIGAFEPIYMSGYLMDKFAFDDIIFNVGLRIDRFDANQKVLKDPFVLGDAITAGETTQLGSTAVTHPGNIGDDYVVYVDDIDNPSTIIGYRDGIQWYNAAGGFVDNPSAIQSTGRPAPYIVGGSQNQLSEDAFKDYDPQVNWMPRIAFSFPISDEALFFAHYDILTQRPTGNNRFNPIDYLYLANSNSPLINNPDLKPSKTIDYELGFQQVLSKTSSLKIAAFYRELRDMIQIRNYTGAYPAPYRTYGNLDFGNTKGLTVTYDLRRTGNIWVKASYTLQFAEGTGSDQNTALALINAGLPNLRTVAPVAFDQRHNIVGTVDYRYGEGSDYNGPMLFGKPFLENTGLNIIANLGSGTPYTAARLAYPITGGISPSTEGSINGSRLPWSFNINANLDKNFSLSFGGEGEDSRTANLNIYLWVSNLLNTRNINSVYRFTGTSDDDGFLASAQFQTQIESEIDPDSFRNYYAMSVDNPFNLNAPRTIRLGASFNF